MAEYINLDKKDVKVLTNKERTNLIIFTYLLNFNLYLFLFILYDSIILKIITFLIINSFASQMLSRKTSIGNINSWTIFYAIVNFFAFGLTSLTFSYNIVVIIANLLYFKYILKRVDLSEKS